MIGFVCIFLCYSQHTDNKDENDVSEGLVKLTQFTKVVWFLYLKINSIPYTKGLGIGMFAAS